jgi:hypothetical protein
MGLTRFRILPLLSGRHLWLRRGCGRESLLSAEVIHPGTNRSVVESRSPASNHIAVSAAIASSSSGKSALHQRTVLYLFRAAVMHPMAA